MKRFKWSYVVVGERGTSWARHADERRARFGDVVVLVQRAEESSRAFAQRVQARLQHLGSVAGVSVLCSGSDERSSLAARRVTVQACLSALNGLRGRELTLVCPPTRNGKLPHWVNTMATGIEQRDPALELFVECEEDVLAA